MLIINFLSDQIEFVLTFLDREPCYTELENRNAAVDLTSLLLSTSPQVLPIILAAIFDAPDVFGDVPSNCWIVSDYGCG